MNLPDDMIRCGCGSVLKWTSYWKHIKTTAKHRRWLENPRQRRLVAKLLELYIREEEAHALYKEIQDERTRERWQSIWSEIGKETTCEIHIEAERLRDERKRLATQG
jgi:catechol-2,3-dioxygenase